LELTIGAYGFALPLLLRLSRPLFSLLYNQFFDHFILYNVLTFIGCVILLGLPVTFMGATLPILCKFYVVELSHLGSRAGRLYFLNTLGAALGALLCGFWLINLMGVQGTLTLAVSINGFIGLSCLLSSRPRSNPSAMKRFTRRVQPPISTGHDQVSAVSHSHAVVRGSLVIFAVSGFCAMAYEVIWTRLLALIVGPTTYSFTIVLVTFILGLALGSAVFGYFADRTKHIVWMLIGSQVIAALSVLAVSQIIGNSQLFFSKLMYVFSDQFALMNVSKAVILLSLMTIPTLCLGATFPLVGKLYTRGVSRVGRFLGSAYAINTIGAVLGSFSAGFVLVPLMGKEDGLSLVILLQLLTALVVAVLVTFRNRLYLRKSIPWVALILVGALLCLFLPHWNRRLLAEGRYHRFDTDLMHSSWMESILHGPELLSRYAKDELVFCGDGISGFTTVLKSTDAFGNVEYVLLISGKGDASSRADMMTQTLLAHFPMLFHRNPESVMVLGLASGITAGEVLHYPIRQLDVIDINPQVVTASHFFRKWNNDVLSQSRTNLIIQDARAHLLLTKQNYDVIISEPSNPWMAGLATLFTHDFLSLAKNKLKENGIFVQWFHSYQIDWTTFAMIGRTFTDVFPNSLLVSTLPSYRADVHGDYLLVGIRGKSEFSLEAVQKNLIYAGRSKNVTILDARLLYKLIVSENLRYLFGQGPMHTDDTPHLEFRAPKFMYCIDDTIRENVQAKRWLKPETQRITNEFSTDVNAQLDFAAYALSVYMPFSNMVDFSKASRAQLERFFKLMQNYCANNPIRYSLIENAELRRACRTTQIESIQNRISDMPDKALSWLYLSNLFYDEGNMDQALACCQKALELTPQSTEAHGHMAYILTGLGRLNEATNHFQEFLQAKPGNLTIRNELGITLTQLGRYDRALDHFAKILRSDPEAVNAQVNMGIALSRLGRLDEAVFHYQQALQREPNLASIHNNLGDSLIRQGKLDQAIAHFNRALQIDPTYATARQNLANALQKKEAASIEP
jgi:spermidine synthase